MTDFAPKPPVLIIAHGQPSDPAPAAAELAALARAVAACLPETQVAAATLAEPGALAAALARLGHGGRAYPLFMAGGWFTRSHLPARLAEAGAQGWQVLEPMGCDPAMQALAVQQVREALATEPDPTAVTVILAAHGSSRSAVPADITRHVAAKIAAETGVAAVRAAFIDQAPRLADLQVGRGPVLCLPYFAAAGGHVTDDLPAALMAAGLRARILPSLGLDRRVPELIARAIAADQPVCRDECRYRARAGQ